jgi:hypothetical protein
LSVRIELRGKQLGIPFTLDLQLTDLRVRGKICVRAPPYREDLRACQFISRPSITFKVASNARVGTIALPFKKTMEAAIQNKLSRLVQRRIAKRMMGSDWLSMQVAPKKELSRAVSQWTFAHKEPLSSDGRPTHRT